MTRPRAQTARRGAVAGRLVAGPAALVLALAVTWVGTPLGESAAAEQAAPEVTAEGAVLWEPASAAVLYDRAAEVGRPMASTTKIMTVLLALEAGDLDDEVTVSARAAEIDSVPGGATLGLETGDRVPLRSLLAGLLLRSGNGAAVAVAEHIAGDEGAYVERMNERADEMGLEETRFLNSSGLTDDPEHRASPLDLARLADVAMDDEHFAEWAGAEELSLPALGPMPTRNELLGAFPGATGVKTGYTSLAGLCLVASATRDGRTLYAVVLGSDDSFADAAALLEHGFDDHRLVELEGSATLSEYRWADAAVGLRRARPAALTVAADASVVHRLSPVPALDRPVSPGTEAGEAVVLVNGEEAARSPLEAIAGVPARTAREPATAAGEAVQDGLRGLLRLRPIDHDL